jgi:hypothetical protein
MIYKFEKLSAKLDEMGFEHIASNGVRIMKRDLTQEANKGNIKFKEDGVYLTSDGKEYKGYMYLKFPDLSVYPIPSFHITECKTVIQQKGANRFDDRYFWSNSNDVTIKDRSTGTVHENVKLKLCGNCKGLSKVKYANTEGFFETLGTIVDDINTKYEVDISGYTLRPINWYQVSRVYRETKNYTCEHPQCGITITEALDKRFIHVHHKDGNKLNNHVSNFECLCVLCHANEDERHIQNFQKKRMQIEVKAFVKKYEAQLRELGNIYLKDK